MPSVRGELSGSSRAISDFDTTACTAAERAKPRTSAQRISHVIKNAKWRASAIALPIDAISIVSSRLCGPVRSWIRSDGAALRPDADQMRVPDRAVVGLQEVHL